MPHSNPTQEETGYDECGFTRQKYVVTHSKGDFSIVVERYYHLCFFHVVFKIISIVCYLSFLPFVVNKDFHIHLFT